MNNTVEVVQPGICLVRFAGKETLTRELCEPLLPPLLAESKSAPIILLADLKDITLIPAGITGFWLDAMVLKGLRVSAIGVVTKSRAVKVVVNAFQAAMRLRSQPIGAETRLTVEEIVEWAKSQAAAK